MRLRPILLFLLVLFAACVGGNSSKPTYEPLNAVSNSGSSISGNNIPIIGDLLSCPKQDLLLLGLGALFYISMIMQIINGLIGASKGESATSNLSGVAISAISFYAVYNLKLYCNYFSLIFSLILIKVIARQLIKGGLGGFSGFGGNLWKGLKGLKISRGPKGEDTKKEVEKEVKSKLNEVQRYIKEMEQKAHARIDHERKQARKSAKQEIRSFGIKRDKYAKIDEKLFEDANELTLLSKDLREDQQAIANDIKQINDFQKTIQTQAKNSLMNVVSFIKKHNEEQATQFTKYGYTEGQMLDGEMKNLEEIGSNLEASFKTTLNGIIYFAKLTVLLETADNLLNVANNYLGNTKQTVKIKEKATRKRAKKQQQQLRKEAEEIGKGK